MKSNLLILALLAAAWSAPACADTLRTFQVSGVFQDDAVMSGTLTVDDDTARVVTCDIRISGTENLVFSRVLKQKTVGLAAVVILAPDHARWPRLIFGEQTFPGALRGYQGGPLGRRTDIVQQDQRKELIVSGRLIPMPSGGS